MLVAIFTSPASGLPIEHRESALAIAGAGLEGDRYAAGKGFYSGSAEWDAHVTLIEREPFEALSAKGGVRIDPADLRRNLLVAGVDLRTLIGKRFRVGERAMLFGRKAWPPCAHIVRTSGRPEIFKYLSRQCGIGADVVEGGVIRLGDPIILDASSADQFTQPDPRPKGSE